MSALESFSQALGSKSVTWFIIFIFFACWVTMANYGNKSQPKGDKWYEPFSKTPQTLKKKSTASAANWGLWLSFIALVGLAIGTAARA